MWPATNQKINLATAATFSGVVSSEVWGPFLEEVKKGKTAALLGVLMNVSESAIVRKFSFLKRFAGPRAPEHYVVLRGVDHDGKCIVWTYASYYKVG